MWNNQSDSLSKIISFSREVSNQLYIEKDPQSLYAPINYISQKKENKLDQYLLYLHMTCLGAVLMT